MCLSSYSQLQNTYIVVYYIWFALLITTSLVSIYWGVIVKFLEISLISIGDSIEVSAVVVSHDFVRRQRIPVPARCSQAWHAQGCLAGCRYVANVLTDAIQGLGLPRICYRAIAKRWGPPTCWMLGSAASRSFRPWCTCSVTMGSRCSAERK